MACKLRRCCHAVLLVAAWVPFNAFPMQFEKAVPVGEEAELAPAQTDGTEAEVDLAFIEFLGQWETDDGEWFAPSDLSDEAFVELIETIGSLETEQID